MKNDNNKLSIKLKSYKATNEDCVKVNNTQNQMKRLSDLRVYTFQSKLMKQTEIM